MKATLECIPCMFNQSFRAGRSATNDPEKIREILNKAGEAVKEIDLNLTPPEAAMPIYRIVEEITGNSDPYKNIKIEHIKRALRIYPIMKEKVKNAEDSLLEAVKIAIAGNAIDLGSTLNEINIEKEFENIERGKFFTEKFQELKELLNKQSEVLYLSDNAGETVFDRPLIEEILSMNKKVIYAVKEKPIINDATYEDAVMSGIETEIVSTGSSIAGTVLKTCSREFLSVFKNARLIITKGQGNYETLSDVKAPIFFLFKVKCNPISIDSGFPVGSMILMKSKNFSKKVLF